MERPPSALYLDCPECEDQTKHKVHKGRFVGKKNRMLKVVVECSQCGDVREEELRQEKEREVVLMISDGGETERTKVVLGEDELFAVGSELYSADGMRTVISAIETKDGKVERASVKEIDRIFVKAREEITVKVSVNKGINTISKDIMMHYDEEIAVGDMIDLDGKNVAVHKIMTDTGMKKRGVARADEIVRIYTRMVREKWG